MLLGLLTVRITPGLLQDLLVLPESGLEETEQPQVFLRYLDFVIFGLLQIRSDLCLLP